MQKKLREVLNQLYAHLDNTSSKTSKRDVSFFSTVIVRHFPGDIPDVLGWVS